MRSVNSCTSLKICTNRSTCLLRGTCCLLQHSLLWGSSPWPSAYRAHALPAELRRPCREAMEPDNLSLGMSADVYVQSLKKSARPYSRCAAAIIRLAQLVARAAEWRAWRPLNTSVRIRPNLNQTPLPVITSKHFPCARSKRSRISLLSQLALSPREIQQLANALAASTWKSF